jgi:uncharacterized membrane protein
MKSFLAKLNEDRITDAIARVEQNATAEIRVHVEKRCKKQVLDRAAEVFAQLNMHRTRYRNGALIYIAYLDHQFAILGDAGINHKVGPDFWEKEKQMLTDHFKEQKFTEGICKVIEEIGAALQKYFPFEPDDINELPDDISFGDQ